MVSVMVLRDYTADQGFPEFTALSDGPWYNSKLEERGQGYNHIVILLQMLWSLVLC